MAIVIAGERSGSGKTTITLSLLAALTQQGEPVQSFKVGPDYIDPMFHRYVTQRPCYNLDPVLTSEEAVIRCFIRKTQAIDLAIVEGVMGLFDGAADPAGYGSTAQVATCLQLPILLVVDCRSISQSVAAIIHGYRSFDPSINLIGVVLNRVGSDRHLEILQAAIAPLHLPILGVFRREDAIALPDRYLGLVPTAELPELSAIVDQLAALGKRCFDWERLMPFLQVDRTQSNQAHSFAPQSFELFQSKNFKVKLAIAQDEAFSFYYAENLELLEHLGAELIDWSPLRDQYLPEDIHGLYFGGGFPEQFAAPLAENHTLRQSLHHAIASGLPTYAECGGLMYLCEGITDFSQKTYPMVGILPTTAIMGKRLTLGYRTAIAQANTPLLPAGAIVRGHEFHRSQLAQMSTQPLFKLRSGVGRTVTQSQTAEVVEGWHLPHLHASYLHLHWAATPELPQRFLETCARRAVDQKEIGGSIHAQSPENIGGI
jgi:cobyrinic acid a,c-diamide synthase